MSGSATIRPHSGRLENLLVWASAAILILAASGFALTRGTETGTPPLADWQVSAFDGLGLDDQAIYSALSVSAEDIGWMQYDSGIWPDIPEIEAMLLPPFLKDAFWDQHGRVAWHLLASADFNHGGATAYIGRNGAQEGQSSYLLVYQHRHMGTSFSNQAQIWVHRDTEPDSPTGFTNENLVRAGWRQVVPYSAVGAFPQMKKLCASRPLPAAPLMACMNRAHGMACASHTGHHALRAALALLRPDRRPVRYRSRSIGPIPEAQVAT